MTATLGVVLAVGLPLCAWVLWPLRRADSATDDADVARTGADGCQLGDRAGRGPLDERVRQLQRTLAELDFEHDAGHLAPADHASLTARATAELAALGAALERLGEAPAAVSSAASRAKSVALPATTVSAWSRPLPLAVAGAALLVLGTALGAGVTRYMEPDAPAGRESPATGPVVSSPTSQAAPRGAGSPLDAPTGKAPRALDPAMLRGMLDAARASLDAGRYGEAIAAYQAVLKREPRNVDALTHLGLIVALGGHHESALETFDRALGIDPRYPPAHLYRGQVLWEGKRDGAGAVRAWERFLELAPAAADREQVVRRIAEVKAAGPR